MKFKLKKKKKCVFVKVKFTDVKTVIEKLCHLCMQYPIHAHTHDTDEDKSNTLTSSNKIMTLKLFFTILHVCAYCHIHTCAHEERTS